MVRRLLAAALTGISLFFPSSNAHSKERNPLSTVYPLENLIIQTPSQRVHAHSSFALSFHIANTGERIRLRLDPNHDLIAQDASLQIMRADGTLHPIEPIDRSEHRIFKGDAFIQRHDEHEWTRVGWARIALHRDGLDPLLEGAFSVLGNHHHVQSRTHFRQTRVPGDPDIDGDGMAIWRDSDVQLSAWEYDSELKRRQLAEPPACDSDNLLYNQDDQHPVYRAFDDANKAAAGFTPWIMSTKMLFGRQIDGTLGGNGAGVNLAQSIGSTAGCPTTMKVALVGIATDCTYTAVFNSTSVVRANIIQQVNTASRLYEDTFNITLGIQNLTISEARCPSTPPDSAKWNVPCRNDVTITDRLNLFSAWRGQFTDTNSYWTLFSTCNTDSAVGLAWLGQLCEQGSQSSGDGNDGEVTASANVVIRTSQEWQVFAHETGHTFGAVHDCTTSTCADGTSTSQQCCPLSASTCNVNGRFLMNPSTSSGVTSFSPCSVGNICSAMGRNSVKSSCLRSNRDVVTITGSQCGNGIVEQGEDCDCGGNAACGDDPCCNPSTCKFTAGSVCDFANEECCTRQCQFASTGTVCRASTESCDPEEVCTGASAACPADVHVPDGTACSGADSSLQCASGQCTSRDLQCKTLMGSLTTSNDTYACSQDTCRLSCASPEFGANVCYTMQQNFLDGTPCAGGGRCSNGKCDGASFASEASSWIEQNKQIVIPVVTVIVASILLSLLSWCVTSWGRRRRATRAARLPAMKPFISPSPSPAGWARSTPAMGPVAVPYPPTMPPPTAARFSCGPPPYAEAWRPGGPAPRYT